MYVYAYIPIYRYHFFDVCVVTLASYSSFLPAKISIFNLPGNQEQGHHWRDSWVGGPYNRWCLEGSDSGLVVLKVPSYCWWFRNHANQLRLVVEIPFEVPLFTGFYTSQVVGWDFWTINSIKEVSSCPKVSILAFWPRILTWVMFEITQ